MTYNATPRRRFTAQQRAAFLLAHGHTCWWCKGLITDPEWDIEHILQREFFVGKEADDDANLAPIHRDPCHRAKSKADAKSRAKSNRIQKSLNPETRRQTRHPIRSRKAVWPKRSFQRQP